MKKKEQKRKAVCAGFEMPLGPVQKKSKVTPSLGVPPAGGARAAESMHFVHLYKHTPTHAITLEQFEAYARNRKNVLQGIDEAKARGVLHKEMSAYVQELLRQHMPEPAYAAQVTEARAVDNASHFVLRLAYSRTETMRKWFVKQEGELFTYRFNKADDCMRAECMQGLESLGEDEYDMFEQELSSTFCWRDMTGEKQYFKDEKEPWTHIYKVPFEQVVDLVRQRKVFLCGGWAYVLSVDTASVAVTAFRERLMRELQMYSRNLEDKLKDEAERVAPLLLSMPEQDASGVFGFVSESKLGLDKLPAAMAASAPACMRRTWQILHEQHHLKHAARLQFGLFLKSVGVSLEDAYKLWMSEFMKGGKSSDEFDKEYSYNLRHMYGQEGSRAKYSGHSCKVVIASLDSTGQTGCPYRACKTQDLERMLGQMKVSDAAVKSAVALAQEQRYQLACGLVYQARYGKEIGQLTHPHQYFVQSQHELSADGAVVDSFTPQI